MLAIEQDEQLLIFRIGPVACCAAVRDVDAIVNAQSLHHLPRQASYIAGVFLYRESTVSVVDMFHKFALATPEDENYGAFIMAHTRHGIVGFWVDEVIEIVNNYDQQWASPPAFIDDKVFDKTLLWQNKLILLTDFNRLFAMSESIPLSQWASQSIEDWEHQSEDELTAGRSTTAQSTDSSISSSQDTIQKLQQRGEIYSQPVTSVLSEFTDAVADEFAANEVLSSHQTQIDSEPVNVTTQDTTQTAASVSSTVESEAQLERDLLAEAKSELEVASEIPAQDDEVSQTIEDIKTFLHRKHTAQDEGGVSEVADLDLPETLSSAPVRSAAPESPSLGQSSTIEPVISEVSTTSAVVSEISEPPSESIDISTHLETDIPVSDIPDANQSMTDHSKLSDSERSVVESDSELNLSQQQSEALVQQATLASEFEYSHSQIAQSVLHQETEAADLTSVDETLDASDLPSELEAEQTIKDKSESKLVKAAALNIDHAYRQSEIVLPSDEQQSALANPESGLAESEFSSTVVNATEVTSTAEFSEPSTQTEISSEPASVISTPSTTQIYSESSQQSESVSSTPHFESSVSETVPQKLPDSVPTESQTVAPSVAEYSEPVTQHNEHDLPGSVFSKASTKSDLFETTFPIESAASEPDIESSKTEPESLHLTEPKITEPQLDDSEVKGSETKNTEAAEFETDVAKYFHEKLKDKVDTYQNSVQQAETKKQITEQIFSSPTEPQADVETENEDLFDAVISDYVHQVEKKPPTTDVLWDTESVSESLIDKTLEEKQEASIRKVIERIEENQDRQDVTRPFRIVAGVLIAATTVFLVEHYTDFSSNFMGKEIQTLHLLNEPQLAVKQASEKHGVPSQEISIFVEPDGVQAQMPKINLPILNNEEALPTPLKGLQEIPLINWRVHTVIRGDTLWDISEFYLKDPFRYPDLARWSGIKNPDLIYPGDEVKYKLDK